ncbi:MAG: menaquinone biosynthesis protein [Candidatus Eremiobacteraeota bacterium]|nr:menaquinone biosynthesis protein [Candidatus Eremiobacteraeota bacterium]
MPNVRCGRIRYTNDLPLYAAFDEGALAFPGTLVSDVPSKLNMELVRGNLDLGPISAAHYARHADELILLDDFCIGARDEVWSVLLVSPTAPHMLDGIEIAVTRDSASARALLQILLERRYGVSASFAPADDPMDAARMRQPTLLIGDGALDARERFEPGECFDLAHLWHEWTEADMVFAVWAARRDAYEKRPEEIDAAVDMLGAARAWGEDHLDRVVARAQTIRPRAEGFYEAYYTQALNFHFDLAARTGLARYIAELDAVGLMPGVFRTSEIWRVAS